MNYFKWHYGRGFVELWNIFKNYSGFLAHFFSLKLLWGTLFQPLKRLGEGYPQGLDVEKFLSALIVNSLMRLLGFISRSAIIIAGLLAVFICLAVFAAVFVFWVFSPLVLLATVAAGAILIFSAI